MQFHINGFRTGNPEISKSSEQYRASSNPDTLPNEVDVRAIFQQGHRELTIESKPWFLLPQKGRYGIRDCEKMFCPDLKSGNDVFDMRKIDRKRGCMVVVQPDQYVAHVLPLDAFVKLGAFFDGVMIQN